MIKKNKVKKGFIFTIISSLCFALCLISVSGALGSLKVSKADDTSSEFTVYFDFSSANFVDVLGSSYKMPLPFKITILLDYIKPDGINSYSTLNFLRLYDYYQYGAFTFAYEDASMVNNGDFTYVLFDLNRNSNSTDFSIWASLSPSSVTSLNDINFNDDLYVVECGTSNNFGTSVGYSAIFNIIYTLADVDGDECILTISFQPVMGASKDNIYSMPQYWFNIPYNVSVIDGTQINYDNGYDMGYSVGYNNGFDAGSTVSDTYIANISTTNYNIGYDAGYSAGTLDHNNYTFENLMYSVIDTPVKVFSSLFNFELFGYNMLTFVEFLLTVALALAIVRVILKSRGG